MSRGEHLLIRGWLAAAALTLAVWPRAIGHDQAALLRNGMQVANGEVPFRDIIDINSPVIHYVSAIPALAARITGTNPIPWFTLGVILLSAWAAVLGHKAFASAFPQASLLERAAVLLVPLGPCALHPTLADAGQREHLFVLLTFPYVLYRIAAARGASVGGPAGRLLIGAAAAIGTAMKPHFLLPVAGFEIGLLTVARQPRLLMAQEVVGAFATAAALVAALFLLPAAAWDVLRTQILPSVRQGYSTYGAPYGLLIERAGSRFVLLLFCAVAAWKASRANLTVLAVPVVGFAAGALAATVVQAKAFGYHYIPAEAAILFMAGLAAAALVAHRRKALEIAVATAMVAAMFSWRPLVAARITRPDAYPFRDVLLEYTQPGDPILVLSGSATYAQPAAMQLDRVDVARQSALPYVLARQADLVNGTPGRIEGRVVTELAQEIESRRPAAIFLERVAGCPTCPPGVGVAGLLENDPRMQRALAAYRHDGVAMGFDVLVRNDR